MGKKLQGFVSCTAKDKKLISVFRQLIRSDIELISCSSLNISGADDKNYLSVIPKAIQNADFFIAVLSPQSVKSEQIEREISFAFNNGMDTVIVYTSPFAISGPINLMLAENNMKCCVRDSNFSTHFKTYIYKITGSVLTDDDMIY